MPDLPRSRPGNYIAGRKHRSRTYAYRASNLPTNFFSRAVQTARQGGYLECRNSGFKAVYYGHDASYYVDPVEISNAARTLLDIRVFGPCRGINAYGIRTDIPLSSDRLFEDRIPGSAPSDLRYELSLGKQSAVLQDGLCIICSHDPALSYSDRGHPWTKAYRQHLRNCLKETIRAIYELFERLQSGKHIPTRHHYMWHEGAAICPDPVCRRRHRRFDNVYDLVLHLLMVHHLTYQGKIVPNTIGIPRLESFIQKSEKELLECAGWFTRRKRPAIPELDSKTRPKHRGKRSRGARHQADRTDDALAGESEQGAQRHEGKGKGLTLTTGTI